MAQEFGFIPNTLGMLSALNRNVKKFYSHQFGVDMREVQVGPRNLFLL